MLQHGSGLLLAVLPAGSGALCHARLTWLLLPPCACRVQARLQGVLLPAASRLLLSSSRRLPLLLQPLIMDLLTMQQACNSSRPQLLVLPLLSCCQSSRLLPNTRPQPVRAHWSQSWLAAMALCKQLGLLTAQSPSPLFPQAQSRWCGPLSWLLLLFLTSTKLQKQSVQP